VAGLIVTTLKSIWEGRIDSCRRIDGPSPIIEVNAEHRLALLDKPDGWRTRMSISRFFSRADTA